MTEMATPTAFFKQVTVDQETTIDGFTDIEGLCVKLPPASSQLNAALVTLNVSEPYVEGGVSNGIRYQIDVDGHSQVVGAFTNGTSQDGRSPFTMVTLIPLTSSQQHVQAQWLALKGATAHLGSSASLSGVFVST
jgi:hypothetical protein